MGKGQSQEVARVGFTDDQLRGITSFDDAVSLAAEQHGAVVAASDELGNGFAVLDDESKGRIVGVPLMLLEWSFNAGDYGEDFVSIRAVAFFDGRGIEKVVINDGGTGIRQQLKDYQDRTGKTGGMIVKNGLRESQYPTYPKDWPVQELRNKPIPKGVDIPSNAGKASTFYLDTSA